MVNSRHHLGVSRTARKLSLFHAAIRPTPAASQIRPWAPPGTCSTPGPQPYAHIYRYGIYAQPAFFFQSKNDLSKTNPTLQLNSPERERGDWTIEAGRKTMTSLAGESGIALARPGMSDSLFHRLQVPTLLLLRQTCKTMRACVDSADIWSELLSNLDAANTFTRGNIIDRPHVSSNSWQRDSLGRLVIADGAGRLSCSRLWTHARKRLLFLDLCQLPDRCFLNVIKIIEESRSTVQILYSNGRMMCDIQGLDDDDLNSLADLVARESETVVQSAFSQTFAASDPRRNASWPRLSTFVQCARLALFSVEAVKRLQNNFAASLRSKAGPLFLAMPHIELDHMKVFLREEYESLIARQGHALADEEHFDRIIELMVLKTARFRIMLLLMEMQVAAADLRQEAGVTFYREDDHSGAIAALRIRTQEEKFLEGILKQIADKGCPENLKHRIGSNHHLSSLAKTATLPSLASLLENVFPALLDRLDLLHSARCAGRELFALLRKLDQECPCGLDGMLPCGECGLLNCQSCAFVCACCEKSFCEDRRDVGCCEECSKLFCEDCRYVGFCDQCGRCICEECGHTNFCEECSKLFCEDCGYVGFCDQCGRCICEECGHTEFCEGCSKLFCEDCGYVGFCDQCGRCICEECGHTEFCEGCSKLFCEDCRYVGFCDQCGKGICNECGHTNVCEECFKSLCEDCSEMQCCDGCSKMRCSGCEDLCCGPP